MSRSNSIPRRRFVKAALAGAALLAAAPLAQAAAAAARTRPAPPKGGKRLPPAALRKEIENQIRAIETMAKVIREFPLPPGSPPAVTFRAMRRKGR